MIKSKMISSGYDIEDAKRVLLNTDHKVKIVEVEEIFYPYVMIPYAIMVGKGRLTKLNKFCICIIDRISGTTYEGKGTPAMVEIDIEEERSLKPQTSIEECLETGHSFVMKLFLGKARLMTTPVISALTEEYFYKKFYIMHCLDDKERDYHIMVDAIDGGLSVLDY